MKNGLVVDLILLVMETEYVGSTALLAKILFSGWKLQVNLRDSLVVYDLQRNQMAPVTGYRSQGFPFTASHEFLSN